uniref:Uncharacterized protein n=1 Tax=Pithovirus LCDPAC02 TaxID=2506601 RepID=A0A481YNG0_9VIRU|nr:MAG: hypothetical protein LCDPAC02_00100 [Pithovirus LCDPAC02]
MSVYYSELNCKNVIKSGKNKGKQCYAKVKYKLVTDKIKYFCGRHCKNSNRIELLRNGKRNILYNNITEKQKEDLYVLYYKIKNVIDQSIGLEILKINIENNFDCFIYDPNFKLKRYINIIFSCHKECNLYIKKSKEKYIFSSNLNCIHNNTNKLYPEEYFNKKLYIDKNNDMYPIVNNLFNFINEYFYFYTPFDTINIIHYDIKNNISYILFKKDKKYHIFEGILNVKFLNIEVTLIDFLTNNIF